MMQPISGVVRRPAVVHAVPDRLRSDVETLAGATIPRTLHHRENLLRAALYLHDQFLAAGAEVDYQVVDAGNPPLQNVVAHVGPETKERIVVGAHYDAADAGVGADDNASGVAGILEIARLAQSDRPPMRLDLVGYVLEEPPSFRTHSMGSFVHASALRRAGIAVRAMICLEMIGFFSDAPGSQSYPLWGLQLFYPSRGDFIAVVGCVGQEGLVRKVKRAMQESAALPVWSMNAPRLVPGIDFSDHLNYWDTGFDAVMVTDTAFYRNANYHEGSDTPATLDYGRMALVVDGVFGAIKEAGR